jgi:protein-tyrosine phosphatase
MAEASIAEGVTHIVCTPHADDSYVFQPQLNQERLAILNEHLGGRLTLGLGCDFYLSYENIEDAYKNRTKYTINGKQFLLVEFPNLSITPAISQTLYRLAISGIVPIITHPERNPVLVSNSHRLIDWLRSGCLIQITAASLTGRFGKRAEAFSNQLIMKNWVHFIASDAHSIDGRPPAMAEAYMFLKTHYGQDTADRLCIHNPRAAFLGQPLPPQPEPIGLFEKFNSQKRNLFGRILGR